MTFWRKRKEKNRIDPSKCNNHNNELFVTSVFGEVASGYVECSKCGLTRSVEVDEMFGDKYIKVAVVEKPKAPIQSKKSDKRIFYKEESYGMWKVHYDMLWKKRTLKMFVGEFSCEEMADYIILLNNSR